MSQVRVKRWGKSPPATAATRRLAKPRPVQGEQGPPRGCPPRARVAAERDGHPRQNPAYRPATEKALETGLSLSVRTPPRSAVTPTCARLSFLPWQAGTSASGCWPDRALEDGVPVELPGGKPRALLTLLLLRAGQTVPRGQLVDDLWGEHVPESAPKMVQIYRSSGRYSGTRRSSRAPTGMPSGARASQSTSQSSRG